MGQGLKGLTIAHCQRSNLYRSPCAFSCSRGGLWGLLWNEVSSWRAAGRGQRSQRKTRHPEHTLRRAGWQTEHLIGWLLSTPAVSRGGCGLTTFFQVSGSSLQATCSEAEPAPASLSDASAKPSLLGKKLPGAVEPSVNKLVTVTEGI